MSTNEIPQIVLRPIDSLVAYARNARTHSPEQISQIKASLIEFGWTNPVLADGVGIVAGHGRTMAAAELYKHGIQIKFPGGTPIPLGMVPVVDCSGWSDAQRRAYIIADNKLALNAGWDEELLRVEALELRGMGYDLGLTGFSDDELGELLAEVAPELPDANPDDVPDSPDQPHSRLGDVWVCGPHRVMCGSSLEIDDWDRLMGGEKADICWTDPPYNVAYESKLAGKIKNDDMSDVEFRQFLRDAFASMCAVMKPGAPIYVAHADGGPGEAFRHSFREGGFKLSGCLIWRKNQFTLSRSDYQWQHEPILYGWKPGSRHRWYGGRKLTTFVESSDGLISRQADGRYAVRVGDTVLVLPADAEVEEHPSSVLYCEKPKRSEQHPTMKPVGLIERMLKASARPGDIAIDGFGGSGSTLIAADRLGMSARLMELDPKFVDVIVRRWEMWSGRRAVHAETGETFPCDGETRPPQADDIPAISSDAILF